MSGWAPLLVAALTVLAQATASAQTTAPRFYPDDPLREEPAPLPVADLQPRALSDILERVNNTLKVRGERHPASGVIPARNVNSLDEVPDGDWYVNRHAFQRMSLAELQRGAGNGTPPVSDAPWQVLVVKPYGLNPGLLITDSRNGLYLLRPDPDGYDGLRTGAQMVTSRFMHALGYHVAETYLVRFDRSQLMVNPEGQTVSSAGRTRRLVADDIDRYLRNRPKSADGRYRAVALRLPEGRQALLGPFQVWGTRSDDPNDIEPHEHHRELRGLFVFAAWLNFSGVRTNATQDILAGPGAARSIRHYWIDLSQSLGNGRDSGPKPAWEGNQSWLPPLGTIGRGIATLGVTAPDWAKAKYPDLPEVGAFESATFDPERWESTQPLPPFQNRLPDDDFWAARQVMAFTDEEIRAVVQTGQYGKAAEDWITDALIERRARIGRAFLSKVLPLDRFRLMDGALAFDDLAVTYGLTAPRPISIEWYGFDNQANTLLAGIGTGAAVPVAASALAPASYVAARLSAGDAAMNVTVFFRKATDRLEIVGIERAWPGKRIGTPTEAPRPNRRVFEDLSPPQQALFATYSDRYNQVRGSKYTPEEGFNRLSVSEQSTFYSITHALANSSLTDMSGRPLGTMLDRIDMVERIAGQYGRASDEEFRLYVSLKPDTRDVFDKSREVLSAKRNTIYHAGYPLSYRQRGREPSIQVSMSEDGLTADIDIDYRSRRGAQAMFNGHLTSANSDVRVGNNAARHGSRWGKIIAWWQDRLHLPEEPVQELDIPELDRADAPATPLPPNRPAGAAPERIEDAAQEVLTDWLVRRQYQEVLQMVSPRAYACLDDRDNGRAEPLDAAGAQRELRKLMEYATKKLGAVPNLTNAIMSVTPRDPKRVVIEHPFRREFLLTPLTGVEASAYLCDAAATAPSGAGDAEYVGLVFRFRRSGGGTIGLLWTREAGRWKLVSYLLLSD